MLSVTLDHTLFFKSIVNRDSDNLEIDVLASGCSNSVFYYYFPCRNPHTQILCACCIVCSSCFEIQHSRKHLSHTPDPSMLCRRGYANISLKCCIFLPATTSAIRVSLNEHNQKKGSVLFLSWKNGLQNSRFDLIWFGLVWFSLFVQEILGLQLQTTACPHRHIP